MNNKLIEDIKKSVKLEDGHLIQQAPIEKIKYGKKILIHPVNWYYDWKPFTYNLGVFLTHHYAIVKNVTLPQTPDDLEVFRDSIAQVISHREAWKALVKICKYSGLKLRWMKKHFSLDDWIEIFLTVFFCNVSLMKRGLQVALKSVVQYQN